MKLSISLGKPKPSAPPPPLARPSAFNTGDDDDTNDVPSTLLSSDGKTAVNKVIIAQNMQASRTTKKRIEAEKKVDATVYEYDEVWDKMQEAKIKTKTAKDQESKERKPKYMQGLLISAATRKLDHLRAEEKMMQRERELEGDQFKDKETFVTQAYKEQMEQVRKAEEEEKRREAELQKKRGGPSTGMAHFYRQLLEESEQQHEATVAATQEKRIIGPQGPIPNLTITKPTDFTPVSDLELARAAREQGKEVEVNDDGQIVDKRDLLSAGLNLSLPNTRRLGKQPQVAAKAELDQPAEIHTAVGAAASRREINERRRREIMQQMEAEKRREGEERQRAEDEKLARVIAKRNNESDVQGARERYLARKRQKLEASEANPSGILNDVS